MIQCRVSRCFGNFSSIQSILRMIRKRSMVFLLWVNTCHQVLVLGFNESQVLSGSQRCLKKKNNPLPRLIVGVFNIMVAAGTCSRCEWAKSATTIHGGRGVIWPTGRHELHVSNQEEKYIIYEFVELTNCLLLKYVYTCRCCPTNQAEFSNHGRVDSVIVVKGKIFVIVFTIRAELPLMNLGWMRYRQICSLRCGPLMWTLVVRWER